MEHDINEDNACPKCGNNCFYEYVSIGLDESNKVTGTYECECPDCELGSKSVKLVEKNV